MLDKTCDSSKIEEKYIDLWEQSGASSANPASDKSPFTIMMPPPNVTGSLHMGHALNMTLQDILTRYNRMRGKDALWQPGTDHAGIATQMVVERNLAAEDIKRQDLGRDEFIKKVWEWKGESGGMIVNQLKCLGTTPDWSRERFTMDEGLSKAVTKVFAQLYKEGLIYRDKRLVNWDPKFHTAISDLEVEQKEQKGHMWHIRYPLEGEQERFITVATTRPETMLGDTAIAVHPDDERYKDLIGKFAMLPLCDRLIPIVADEYADPEQGSGAVKITPAHDFNDFEVGKRHNLPMINILDKDAKINDNAPEAYRGMDRFDARKKIVADLDDLDFLVKIDDIKHAIPYGDRSGVIIEPLLTDQWFVDAATLAKPALEAVKTGKTEFVPKQWENTYFRWLEDIQPWCISRQLWWGHQIPAWYGPDEKIFVAETEDEAKAQAREEYGEDLDLTRDDDVLDTWFSSALWPFSTIGWPDQTPELAKYYPGDVLITGFDIIFFWVARMMMMGMHFMKDVPFKKVYIHALVRDGKGQKMSKSKGNVIDPLELIEKFGADSLRFTLTAMAAQGRDIRLSEDRVEGYRNFTTKLWNAARYCQMNECYPNPEFKPEGAKHVLNKWIISDIKKTKESIDIALENYRFNDAALAAYQFVWGTFCDWYLEFTKPVLGGDDKQLLEETRQTTGWILNQILVILNPLIPFMTEELYASMNEGKKGLLINHAWPEYDAKLHDDQADAEINWLIDAVTEIRSVRADMNVPASAQLTLMIADASDKTKVRFDQFGDLIKRMARINAIEFTSGGVPKGSIQTVVEEATFILPIADIIDLDKERARLNKEMEKLTQDINKIQQKLNNTKFIQNAPEEVVEEQKQRKEQFESKVSKIEQALKVIG